MKIRVLIQLVDDNGSTVHHISGPLIPIKALATAGASAQEAFKRAVEKFPIPKPSHD